MVSKNKARVIQICGTGSGVGKSVIVAGLCRILRQDGFKVAPFKAQNMALNSAVTEEGLEIGRAQAMQAAACGIAPSVLMNPVLLKPTSDLGSQVIVRGRSIGNMSAVKYYAYKTQLFSVVKQSIKRLREEYDIVVIEGAGSPAEINLKKHDIVNMRIARLLKAPVLLVGDIDCGGVFAWLWGTLSLLTKGEQKLIQGLIINKFRGDLKLLKSGISFLEKKSKKDVLGVIPYYTDISLPQEDSLFFKQQQKVKKGKTTIQIAVIRLAHIANFTDFDLLGRQESVQLNYTVDPEVIKKADCIILPGTKNTLDDLAFIFRQGLAEVIQRKASAGTMVVGICGGFQMLGRFVKDTSAVESKRKRQEGLGLLNVGTQFRKNKKTFLVVAQEIKTKVSVAGYEIHHGQTTRNGNLKAVFLIKKRGTRAVNIEDGARNQSGNIWGSYIHGLFDNHEFRCQFLNKLRRRKGLRTSAITAEFTQDEEFDKLAGHLRAHLDIKRIKEIILANGKSA